MKVWEIRLYRGLVDVFDEAILVFLGVVVVLGVLLDQLLDILLAVPEVGVLPPALVVSDDHELEGVLVAV